MRVNSRQYAAIRRRHMLRETEREAKVLAKRAERVGALLGFDEEAKTSETPAHDAPPAEVVR